MSAPSHESVDERARWIEGHIEPATGTLERGSVFLPARVFLGIHAADEVALALVLDPRVRAGIEQRATDQDDPSREKTGTSLERQAADLERAVAAHAAFTVHGERRCQLRFVNWLVVHARCSLVDFNG